MIHYRNSKDWRFQLGAGGVVYRFRDDSIEFILLIREGLNKSQSYHLPKGTLEKNESLEACALREIREEAGVETKLVEYLGGITQDFNFRGREVDRTVIYYLAEYKKDTPAGMDLEHDKKVWVSDYQAIEILRGEPKQEDLIVERAIKYLGAN